MNYGIPIPLLPFLGACLYGDAAAYYVGLNEAERAELEAQRQSFGKQPSSAGYLNCAGKWAPQMMWRFSWGNLNCRDR